MDLFIGFQMNTKYKQERRRPLTSLRVRQEPQRKTARRSRCQEQGLKRQQREQSSVEKVRLRQEGRLAVR